MHRSGAEKIVDDPGKIGPVQVTADAAGAE
jgi:hypothetical protein